jgi:hypothetical protein
VKLKGIKDKLSLLNDSERSLEDVFVLLIESIAYMLLTCFAQVCTPILACFHIANLMTMELMQPMQSMASKTC